LLVAVAEMALAGDMGADIAAPAGPDMAGWLFGEDQGRYIVATPDPDALLVAARDTGVAARVIGHCGGQALTVNGAASISVSELRGAHEAWLPDFMSGR
jgi:phosphoribosylformylglycinamidine synthase subunit PurL